MNAFQDRLYMFYPAEELDRFFGFVKEDYIIDYFIEGFNSQGIFFDVMDSKLDYHDDFPYGLRRVSMTVYYWVDSGGVNYERL